MLNYTGLFGIERETLRVDSLRRLAQSPHPFGDDPHITRDFCENQVEIVTPVCTGIDQAVESLKELDAHARQVLSSMGEEIWLYSNPPHFSSEDDIPIAQFSGAQSSKRSYREVLQRKYGKRLMLFSGIHFNFSFSDETLRLLGADSQEKKDSLYLRLYKKLMTHSWLLVLLTAASPWYDRSLDKDGESGIIKSSFSSIRSSSRGYWNQFVPVLEHGDIQGFCRSIRSYVDKGMLYSSSELYLPVRLKPRGVNSLEGLENSGVDHIELRMFDLNPLHPLGIDPTDLKFAYLLSLWLLDLPDIPFGPEEQLRAVRGHQTAALLNVPEEYLSRADEILTAMESRFSNDQTALGIISCEREKLSGRRPSLLLDINDIF